MVLVQKWPLFQFFFMQNIVPEKFFYGIVQRKNAVVGEKLTFFQRASPMVFVQKWPLFQPVFLSNIGLENVFYDTLQRKNFFLGYKMSLTIFQNKKTLFQAIKTKSSKSKRTDIFPKGLTHGLSPKMPSFPNFFFQAIQARKMSFTIFQNKKKPFQAIKTRSSKTRKIHIFPKGLTHGLVKKMTVLPNFFFRQYKPLKCLLRYSRTKKSLSSLQKQEVQDVEKLTFFQKS